jgi:mercuric reductase
LKDLVIIGWGAAGFAALIKANQLGFKPTIIGYGPIGGTWYLSYGGQWCF